MILELSKNQGQESKLAILIYSPEVVRVMERQEAIHVLKHPVMLRPQIDTVVFIQGKI